MHLLIRARTHTRSYAGMRSNTLTLKKHRVMIKHKQKTRLHTQSLTHAYTHLHTHKHSQTLTHETYTDIHVQIDKSYELPKARVSLLDSWLMHTVVVNVTVENIVYKSIWLLDMIIGVIL